MKTLRILSLICAFVLVLMYSYNYFILNKDISNFAVLIALFCLINSKSENDD